jgi:hypothetical protein
MVVSPPADKAGRDATTDMRRVLGRCLARGVASSHLVNLQVGKRVLASECGHK